MMKTSSVLKDGKSRTVDEFMADQIKFEQKRFEKLQNTLLKDKEEASTFFKPQVSRGTEKILSEKKKTATVKEGTIEEEPVYERLYQQKQQQASNIGKSSLPEDGFMPKINKKS